MKNIELNFQRLSQADYSFEKIFQPAEYDWPGDWEGRALLAFACHYEMHGEKIECMDKLVDALPAHTNSKLYFGKEYDGNIVDEQQLSGHSWYLRGLLKYAKLTHSEFAMKAAKSTVENLYLPIADKYKDYTLTREKQGGVSGNVTAIKNGWRLSSDVGCAFMCVDGLSHYYKQTRDLRVKEFLDKVLAFFQTIDYVGIGFQTHTTLSCARGVLTLYSATGEKQYLDLAQSIFERYVQYGMTLTYENFNWFGREDTWTEPCAIVDSFILATELYKATNEEDYRVLARRIWFNGLQFCQRKNGGAGPNTCVTIEQPILRISLYEAPFCCTMRYAEGLLEYTHNQTLFGWNENAQVETDDDGRKFLDDKLLVMCDGEVEPLFSGHELEKNSDTSVQILF